MTKKVWRTCGRFLLLTGWAASGGCSDAVDGSKCQPNTKCGSIESDAGTDIGENTDVGGGDGPTAPAAQAAISLHVQEYDVIDPTHGMDRCPPSRHWVNVPYQRDRPATNQTQQTSDSFASTKAVNNQDGNAVACAVRANGDRFSVSADASGYASNNTETRKPSSVHIRIPSIGKGDTNAAGTLTIQDDASIVPYMSDQCTFKSQGGSLDVKPGAVWASVRCEGLADPSSPGSVCMLDTGFFLFENCAQ